MRVVRGRTGDPHHEDAAPVNGHLTHPITDLYNEITNDRATWTDATFWFVLGVLLDTLKDLVIAMWVK